MSHINTIVRRTKAEARRQGWSTEKLGVALENLFYDYFRHSVGFSMAAASTATDLALDQFWQDQSSLNTDLA